MIDQDVATGHVARIKEGIEHKNMINKFQDLLIYTINNQDADDSTSETCTANTRYKYTADELQHPSGLDPALYFLHTKDLIGMTQIMNCMADYCKLQIVQCHYHNNYCKRKIYKNLINPRRKTLWPCWIE